MKRYASVLLAAGFAIGLNGVAQAQFAGGLNNGQNGAAAAGGGQAGVNNGGINNGPLNNGAGGLFNPSANGALPGAGFPPVQGMTPQQLARMQQIMQLRALQSRGHHQPKTGTPQFGNFAPNGGGQQMQMPDPTQYAQPAASSGGKKTTAEKRAEANAAKEERKKVLREQAEQKKLNAPKPLAKAKVKPAAEDQ